MRSITTLLCLLFSVGFTAEIAAENSDSIVAELKHCAGIENREDRVECYESLGRRVTHAEQESTAEVASATAASVEVKSSNDKDTMGGYEFETKSAAEQEAEQQMKTRVVLCQKNIDGIWYFKLENGQVWKQVDRQRLAFQGCDFGAIVTNDGIGYVLRIDGREGKIRIRRRK
ncbi:MAG: hypothetical protein P8L70_02135 [Halioglobus sp.]|mgnify:FL=1|jgi:hypothetical protein|nr:hypothetical protein GPB2148_355 [marine gamma proteobacterium HTCC2148]MDG1387931.1 hypothetical protein [Halioglobus sp.]MDG2325507.1 hypothetical protein [Halioglobus sp.]